MEQSRPRKRNLFSQEAAVLKTARAVFEKEDVTDEEIRSALEGLCDSYEELLDQSKLITKVSDRLQKKINKTNDQLELKNVELQETLDSLTKAKVGRKAATITLVIFIVLFLVAEGLIEPYIDTYVREHFTGLAVIGVQLGSKAVLALFLKPIESIVEKILMKQAETKLKEEKAAAAAAAGPMGSPIPRSK